MVEESDEFNNQQQVVIDLMEDTRQSYAGDTNQAFEADADGPNVTASFEENGSQIEHLSQNHANQKKSLI